MFQHVTLKRRWPPNNLALVLCFNMWLCGNIFVFWHHVRSKPKFFWVFFLMANLYITIFLNKCWLHRNWSEIPRQILLFSCLGMTPTLPCFSFVFTRHPKEFDMTYYIHSKQRDFSPFVMILSQKPLFAPRCK
jgi:hypothetical protein